MYKASQHSGRSRYNEQEGCVVKHSWQRHLMVLEREHADAELLESKFLDHAKLCVSRGRELSPHGQGEIHELRGRRIVHVGTARSKPQPRTVAVSTNSLVVFLPNVFTITQMPFWKQVR